MGVVLTEVTADFAVSAATVAVVGASVLALDETEVSGAGLTVETTARLDVAGTAGEITVFLALLIALVVDAAGGAFTAADLTEDWPVGWSNWCIFCSKAAHASAICEAVAV